MQIRQVLNKQKKTREKWPSQGIYVLSVVKPLALKPNQQAKPICQLWRKCYYLYSLCSYSSLGEQAMGLALRQIMISFSKQCKCVYGILHFKTPVLLFIHVSSYSPVPVVWSCWLEASHGGWEASVGAPPHRRVPAGHARWHRSRRAHHRTTEPEGQGGSPHRNTLTGTCTQPSTAFHLQAK